MQSSKPIKKGQIEDYISNSTQSALNLKEDIINKVDIISGNSSIEYPTENAVVNFVADAISSLPGQTENFNWKYSTNTTAGDPGSGFFRANNSDASLVTELYIDSVCDQTGLNIDTIFTVFNENWEIYIQQTNDATKFARFSVSAPLINNTGWWTIPVTFIQAGTGGSLNNNAKCTFYFVNKNSDTNSTNNLSTTLISGGDLSINGDNTKFDITEAIIKVVIPTGFQKFTIPAQTAITPSYLLTDPVTYIGLDEFGIVQSQMPFDSTQRRSIVPIGVVVHSNNVNINTVNILKHHEYQLANQLTDYIDANSEFINIIGNIISPNGVNLNLDKSEGEVFKLFVNTDQDNPHHKPFASATTFTFRYRLQNSFEYADTINVDPDNYDLNGVLTPVPAGTYTTQRVYIFPSGLIRAQYGQRYYETLADAVTKIPFDSFQVEENISQNGLLLGFISLKEGVTDLSDERYVKFTKANDNGHAHDTPIDTSVYRSAIYSALSTGVIEGLKLSVNLSNPQTFDLSAGVGVIVDNSIYNPPVKEIYKDLTTGITATYRTTAPLSYIYLDSNGDIQQSTTQLEGAALRDNIQIGTITHLAHNNIEAVSSSPVLVSDTQITVKELVQALGGVINISGNVITGITSTLTVNKTAGQSFVVGGNYLTEDFDNPNIINNAVLNAPTLVRVWRDGLGGVSYNFATNTVDPNNYDNGTGTLVPIVPANRYQIQRFFFYPTGNRLVVAYGQTLYNNISDAKIAISTENFDLPGLPPTSIRSYLIIKNGTTDLTNTNDAQFLSAGVGGAPVVYGSTTLQQSYLNSLVPQFLINSVQGTLTFKNGDSGQDSNKIIQVQNYAGTNTWSVDGNGNNTANSFIKSGGTASQYLMADGSVSTLTNPITGTGTTNTIPKFNSVSGLTNSNITDNGSLVSVNSLSEFKGTTASDGGVLGSELAASTTGTGTNWTGTNFGLGYTHTPGSTVALTGTLAAVIGTYYQIAYTITGRTAGSITIAFGGQSITSITATGAFGPQATTTGVLTITPTTDFNGTVAISIRTIGQSSATVSFKNSSGTVTNELRALSLSNNTAIGFNAGLRITTGAAITAFGRSAGQNNTTGTNWTAIGESAGQNNTTSGFWTALGSTAGRSNTTGAFWTALGFGAGQNNTAGSSWLSIGTLAGFSNTTGSFWTAIGRDSGQNNTSDSNWLSIGYQSAKFLADGTTNATSFSNSTYVGTSTKVSANGVTNEIVIGYNATGNGSNSVTIGDTNITKTILRGNVETNGSVKVGTDSTAASAANVGAIRYRSDANNSYMDMVMQTGAATYEWVNVLTNTW